ncbi:MAG: hypothetical protein ACREWG_06840 [Gammaproteobacteria bacterium]
MARTNSRGTALVPRARAYEKNNIDIEQADLPLHARFTTLQMNVTPAFRSGVLADFGVCPANAALLTVVLSDRAPLPAGAIVRMVGGKEQFSVARRQVPGFSTASYGLLLTRRKAHQARHPIGVHRRPFLVTRLTAFGQQLGRRIKAIPASQDRGNGQAKESDGHREAHARE